MKMLALYLVLNVAFLGSLSQVTTNSNKTLLLIGEDLRMGLDEFATQIYSPTDKVWKRPNMAVFWLYYDYRARTQSIFATTLNETLFTMVVQDSRDGSDKTFYKAASYNKTANKWTLRSTTQIDKTLEGSGMTFSDGLFYITSGFGYDTVTRSEYFERGCKVINAVTGEVRAISPLKTGRQLHTVVKVGDQLYVIGGIRYLSSGLDIMKGVEKYDINTNTWVDVAPMNNPRYNAVSVAYEGKIYVAGGSGPYDVKKSFERYDPMTNTWTQLPDNPAGRYEGATMIAANGFIHICGGHYDWMWYAKVNFCERFDVNKGSWVSTRDNLVFATKFAAGVEF